MIDSINRSIIRVSIKMSFIRQEELFYDNTPGCKTVGVFRALLCARSHLLIVDSIEVLVYGIDRSKIAGAFASWESKFGYF